MFDTPAGQMAAGEEEGKLVRLWLPGQPLPRVASHETTLLAGVRSQVLEYLAGERKAFSVPLQLQGTPFQMRAWEALQSIPWGSTWTYRQLAEACGSPRGSRAAGAACSRNPVPIIVPCHRVVGCGGTLNGYAGGLELKRRLLELEGVSLPR